MRTPKALCPEKQSPKPVIDERSQVLILGTLPGDESLERLEYYANPRNQFWTILARVYDEPPTTAYQAKVAFLLGRRLALWDVLKSAERSGSMDGTIRNPTVNDFAPLLARFPALRTLAFNGSKAEEFFSRFAGRKKLLETYDHLSFLVLPSTSPTPGRHVLSLEDKIFRWRMLAQLTRPSSPMHARE